jgi:cytochrome P450
VLVEGAVEEALRFESPIQGTLRTALVDVELGSASIWNGRRLWLLIGSANRDPARFHHADDFDPTRSDNRHLSFGSGAHYCLGATLARAEARIALATLARRLPEMRLATDPVAWVSNITLRGLERLNVRY